jgi:hypothetical protein
MDEPLRAGQIWKDNESNWWFVVSVPLDIRNEQTMVVYRPTKGGEHLTVDLDTFVQDKRRVR